MAAAKDLNGRLLFLAGPLTAEQARALGVTGGEAYQALGGQLGAVETPDRVTTSFVEEYLRSPADKRLAWAGRALAVPNPFLRRSAVLEARAHLRGADKEMAVEVLNRAIRAVDGSPAVKLAAVTALESSESDRAATILGDLAKNTDAAAPLRRQAIESLARVRGGKDLLTVLSGSNDVFLSTHARDVLIKSKKPPDGPTKGPPADLPVRLKSADVRVLQAAAVEARRYQRRTTW